MRLFTLRCIAVSAFCLCITLAAPQPGRAQGITPDDLPDMEAALWDQVDPQNEPRAYYGFKQAFPITDLPVDERLDALARAGRLIPIFVRPPKEEITTLQQNLFFLGYDPGDIDGINGPGTQAALQQFLTDLGLPSDGKVTVGAIYLSIAARTLVEGTPEAAPVIEEPMVVIDDGGDGGSAAPDGPTRSFGGIRASRIFAGPDQHPPENFAAYGIVAFKSLSFGAEEIARHTLICNAYVSRLPAASDLTVPISSQMVTIWPIKSDQRAAEIAGLDRLLACDEAVRDYGLVTSLNAINEAVSAGLDLSGNGPYLLAWSPARFKGDPEAPVLSVNMSDVTTAEQALRIFDGWATEIEKDPNLWVRGWEDETLRARLRRLVTKYGSIFAFANVR